MKIALIRERKSPPDLRVALSPNQCRDLMMEYPDLEIVAESSPNRAFSDQSYLDAGILVVNEVNDAEILLGIKEVPIEALISNKTYLFFSHTIKKQSYNRQLLKEIIDHQIRLIDYECLEYENGGRILGFGHWAGVIGAYNGLLTWGKKFKLYTLKPAFECDDYEDLKSQLINVADKIPPIRIGLTGTGRVAHGSIEILKLAGIEQIQPLELLEFNLKKPAFTNFQNEDIYRRKGAKIKEWDTHHFYTHHNEYEEHFSRFLPHIDLLINGFYWEPSLDPLFTKLDTANTDFAIKVIADITCDIEGSVPITIRDTHPSDPTFGWDPKGQREMEPFSEDGIDVMAVSTLPSEIPKDASVDFGQMLSKEVIPLFVSGDKNGILKRATITSDGALTADFEYLSDYVNQLD
jgi:alanine dehydrogenase